MYSPLLLPAIATSFLVCTSAESLTSSSPNFLEYDRSLVLFTSRSLASIPSLEPVFKRACENASTQFITIDCDQELDLCNDHDINSYPTIRLFEKSKDEQNMHMTRYRGPRTEKAIRDFVKRRELPIVTHIETAQLETLKEINDIVVVAYLPPDSPTLLSIFTSIASQHHFDFVFGYTTSASDASKENLPVPSIKIFKNADDDHRILNGAFTASSLSNFLTTAVPKVIRDFREKDLETFMQRDKLTLYIFTSSEDQACALRTGLTPLAKKYEKYVVFAVADGEKHKEMASNFLARFDAGGVGGGLKMPGVVVHAPLNDNVFMYARGKEIEQEVVESMLVTILQGKARSGDVFGREASDVEEGGREEWGHDEL